MIPTKKAETSKLPLFYGCVIIITMFSYLPGKSTDIHSKESYNEGRF